MSVETVWSLKANASPRSLCVYSVSHFSTHRVSTNPFDTTHTNKQGGGDDIQHGDLDAIAVVYGTDGGSLHYRTYESPSQRVTPGSSAPSQQQQQVPALPLGVNGNLGSSKNSSFSISGGNKSSATSNAGATLPRQYFPMDLVKGALAGPVVACIHLGGSSHSATSTNYRNQYQNSTPPNPQGHYPTGNFLLLIDDGRGTSVTQPGAYAAVFVKASLGSFQTIQPNFSSTSSPRPSQNQQSSSFPRMSCASYYSPPDSGGMLVYGAGRVIQQIPPDVWENDETVGKRSNQQQQRSGNASSASSRRAALQQKIVRSRTLYFPSAAALPAPGIRSGQDGLAVTSHGNVVVCAVGNSFYAVVGTTSADDHKSNGSGGDSNNSSCIKLLSFQQSSQVHPVIVFDVQDESLDPEWSCLFLASGRECAVTDLYCYTMTDATNNASSNAFAPRLHCSKPRNGTVTLASPILAAAPSWPWIAVLTSDGLVSIRSPSCLAISLRTVEVGQRPNDYFVLRTVLPSGLAARRTMPGMLTSRSSTNPKATQQRRIMPWIVAAAYSAECKVLQCQPDSSQDLADRLMRHSIDAFGATGFPRSELAEAVNASFTAASYVGPEPSSLSRSLLQQYLEAVLGLADFESGATSGWPTAEGDRLTTSSTRSSDHVVHHGTFATAGPDGSNLSSGRGVNRILEPVSMLAVVSPPALLSGTALLCLVCSQLNPLNNSSLASRAAKACSEKMGVVFEGIGGISKATVQVCDLIAEKLLREASSSFTLLVGSSPSPIASTSRRSLRGGSSQQSNIITDFIEAAIWLLRSCGKHERAIEVAYERLQQQQQLTPSHPTTDNHGNTGSNVRGVWSQIKYESHTATHLSELWSAGSNEGCRLVLSSQATHRLLENNPRLGLSVFTAMHPQNEAQWRALPARDDPFSNPDRIYKVLKLLKSINPSVPYDNTSSRALLDSNRNLIGKLPLESGRAVTVTFLRSAIGIDSGRPADEEEFDRLPPDSEQEEHIANFHDELSFLLLEGIIAERRDDETSNNDGDGDSTELGRIYRLMLRQLLRWPLAKIRSDRFMKALPSTFLQEKALVLGRLGRHEDALRILYRDLDSLDLALQYCDDRHARQKAKQEVARARQQQRLQSNMMYPDMSGDQMSMDGNMLPVEDNAYLPLVRVALDSQDAERGTATAIKVLALRRGAIDRAAALRLLPSEVPVSAVARPFLIPALVDSESQVRRLKVVSALLRSRYLRLKEQLTSAQLKAQANIHVVPALKSLNLGNPLHSSKAFKVRSSASTTSPAAGSSTMHMPEVQVVKHFFPRHLVIQARITNSNAPTVENQYSFHQTGPSASNGRILSDIAFVVAESSEEAIQPLLQVPIPLLPWKMTGSAWCVLQAAPALMDGATAQLTCELRYTVQSVDASTAFSSTMGSPMLGHVGLGRTYVEELQDMEVLAAHFS